MSGTCRRALAIGLCATLLPLGALAAPIKEHVFEPGDEIAVSVLTAPDALTGYQQTLILSEEGMITMPHVGRVTVIGHTASELLPDLDRQYRKRFAYASVGLQLLKAKPLEALAAESVYIAGQVRNPGSVSPSQAGKRLTLADLIGRSGGPTETADLEHVTIYRRQGAIEVVNLNEAFLDGSAARIELAPGETVRVPGSWLQVVNTYAPVLQVAIGMASAITLLVGFWGINRAPASP